MTDPPDSHLDPPLPGEASLIARLIPLLEALIEKSHLTGTTYRDTHAKGHAAVLGTFTVEPGLPPELAVGLFARPQAYPVWVRFSNLNPTPQPDAKKDVRALAMKLMDVDGEMLWQSEPGARTLDLVMMSSQTFLAPDLQTFYDMEVAIFKGGLHLLWFFLTHPRVFLTIGAGQQRTASLLEIPYWSQTAYALGDRAVQYHMQPHQPAASRLPQDPSPNYLRERLARDLLRREAAFDFMVQLQTDPVRMPIENPMVAWDPRLSPYRKVATLRLPAQTFDSPAQMRFCEDLSYSPWRTLPEHRPLGAVNRARLQVYPAISRFRHRQNDAPIREPRPSDPVFEDGEPPAGEPPGRPPGSPPEASGRTGGKWTLRLLRVLLAAVVLLAVLAVVIEANTTLPAPVKLYDLVYLNQKWTTDQRQWFYHTSQGSQLMPYSWFVNLEQSDNDKLFLDPSYLSQFRMIPDPNPVSNPDHLPVGFAKDYPDPLTGVENVGITCAGCHTSQLTYHGLGLQIDGAPGNVNFNVLLQRIGFSLAATAVDPVKFNRFARRVLGDAYNPTNKCALRKQLNATMAGQIASIWYGLQANWRAGLANTTPGFGRIDALGSGGNAMFGQLAPGATNLRTLNAPVKVIQLWNAYHYDWVQSNGSIRQPMARNIIESLAVNASLMLPPRKGPIYASSVRMKNMRDMENLAAQLEPPRWPAWLFGRLDQEKAARGRVLYQQFCARCHQPRLETPATYQQIGVVPPGSFPPDQVSQAAGIKLLFLPIFDVKTIGTDPYDALNFNQRTADATAIGLHATEPGANVIYQVITGIMDRYYQDHHIPPTQQVCWNGERGNLWRAPTGYPARPLAGIWAAAPYLHNGSVPNLYELLLPVAQRSKTFWRGSVEFDPVRVGYRTNQIEGGFELVTTKTGNGNTGHEFNDGGRGRGVIGRLLTDEERWQLVEYLKAMTPQDDAPVGMAAPLPPPALLWPGYATASPPPCGPDQVEESTHPATGYDPRAPGPAAGDEPAAASAAAPPHSRPVQ